MTTLEVTLLEENVDPAPSASTPIVVPVTPVGVDEATTLELCCFDPHGSSTAAAGVGMLAK